MKQEKGITTTTVIIYIIAVLFVLATLSTISKYFYKVIYANISNQETSTQYTTFVSYFLQDVEEKENKVVKADTYTQNSDGVDIIIDYIQFSNGNIYKYSRNNKAIYKNDIKICEGVDSCTFGYTTDNNGKNVINIDFKAGGFDKTNTNKLKFYI